MALLAAAGASPHGGYAEPLTYQHIQAETAAECMRLAGRRWDQGEYRQAATLARKAHRLRIDAFGPEDALAVEIEKRFRLAMELLAREAETDRLKALMLTPNAEVQRLAEAGDTEAAHELGVRLAYGLGGLEADPDQALGWFEMALAGQRPETAFEAGLVLRERRIRSALAGLWAGQAEPVESDPALGGADLEELRLFNQAAREGHLSAKAFLGLSLIEQSFLEGGETRHQVEEEGWSLLRESARAGNAWGEYLLAATLAQGFGTPPNRALAESWVAKAAEQGLPAAKALRAALALAAPGPRSTEQAVGAYADLLFAAIHHDRSAQYRLGRALVRGEGVQPEPTAGRAWLERAAERGHLPAGRELLKPPPPATAEAPAPR